MGFREKMAWIMTVSLIIFGGIYFYPMTHVLEAVGFVPAASAALGSLALIALIFLATVGATIAALSNVKDANAPLDEREALIISQSQRAGGAVLGLGVIGVVVYAHFSEAQTWVVPGLIGLLILSQLATYGSQIRSFRRDR